MMRVVDTSVVLSWYVQEEGSAAALPLIGADFVAPNLLITEIANAVWKKARRSEIAEVQALAILAEVDATIVRLPHESYLNRALELALVLRHPVYDCIFLAMAEAMDMRFVTADRRFAHACRNTEHAARFEIL